MKKFKLIASLSATAGTATTAAIIIGRRIRERNRVSDENEGYCLGSLKSYELLKEYNSNALVDERLDLSFLKLKSDLKFENSGRSKSFQEGIERSIDDAQRAIEENGFATTLKDLENYTQEF